MILYQYPPSITSIDTTGLATSAKQDLQTTELQAIKTAVETIDNAISGNEMQVDVVTSSLPTGAATSANQTTLITNTTNIPNIITTEGGAQSSHILQVGGHNGSGVARHIRVSNTGVVHVDVQSSALPSGAATQATLANIDGNIVTLLNRTVVGQQNMANSQAVVIASDQSAIPISGSITATPVVPSAVTAKNARISVGTTAVRLTTDGSAPSSTRQMLLFRPLSTSTAKFYWGASGVTTANGTEIFPGESEKLVMDANDYYIISDTAAQSVNVIEAE